MEVAHVYHAEYLSSVLQGGQHIGHDDHNNFFIRARVEVITSPVSTSSATNVNAMNLHGNALDVDFF